MGLGPGGQPISATQLSMGGGMGSMGPGGKSVFFFSKFYRASEFQILISVFGRMTFSSQSKPYVVSFRDVNCLCGFLFASIRILPVF